MVNSLFFGDSGLSFNLLPVVDGQAQVGLSFASVPNPMFKGNVTCGLRYTGVITAVNVVVQGAMNDVDAQYVNLAAASTNTAGEVLQILNVPYRFYRVKKVSSTTTGGTITAELTLN